MKKIRAVLSLYAANELFWALAIMVAVMMLGISFSLHHFRYWLWLEDLSYLWHLFWVCLAFQFGILIKRQIASPFAHLLPGYRPAHIGSAVVLWGALAVVSLIWLWSLPKIVVAPQKGPMEMLCVLTFLVTLILAYLSIRPVFLVCYAVVLVAYAHVMNIYDFIIAIPGGTQGLVVLILSLAVLFVWRLFVLKEGMLEYPFLFAWPPHRSLVGDVGVSSKEFRSRPILPFYRRHGVIAKSLHWAKVEKEGLFGLMCFLLAGATAFEIFVVKFGTLGGFYAKPFANFLILMLFPVFLTVAFTYRILAYGEYALLRPLRREELVRQWGFLVGLSLLVMWALVVTVFAVLPAFLLDLPFARTARFWWYLVLSGVFAQMTMAFLAYLTSLRGRVKATLQCLLYVSWLAALLAGAASFEVPMILALIVVSTAVGFMYGTLAYTKWCREEVF